MFDRVLNSTLVITNKNPYHFQVSQVIFDVNRKLRPTKSTYQFKEEQVNFLLEDIEKNLEEYKKVGKRGKK